jgi:capsid protein
MTPQARALARQRSVVGNRNRMLSSGYDSVNPGTKRKSVSSILKHEDRQLKNNDRHKIIGSTRNLCRNFALVAWAIRKHLDYVSAFDFQMRTDDDDLNNQIESLMKVWQRPANCDVCGRHSFSKMLRMFESRRTVDGDVFALKLQTGSLQAIEGDRIRQPDQNTSDGTWYNGIRVNLAGATAEYALWDRDNVSDRFQFSRNVPARNMIQHGYFDRFDQVRGVSPLAAAINSFQDVYEGIDYALAKMKVEQLFALVFKRDAEVGMGTTSGTESEGYEVNFGNGPVQLDLNPGDDAQFLKTDNPGSNTREFINMVLSIAMKALDLPYNFFDESHTNFFGSRSAWLLYDRSCQHKRADVLELLRKVTVWKLQQWIVSGDLRLPQGMTVGDLQFEWVHRGMPWWDPAKEINGAVAAIKAGLDNPYRICKETGRGEYEENVDAIAKAMAYAREKGVPLEFVMQPEPVVEPVVEPNNSRGRQ